MGSPFQSRRAGWAQSPTEDDHSLQEMRVKIQHGTFPPSSVTQRRRRISSPSSYILLTGKRKSEKVRVAPISSKALRLTLKGFEKE
jgi:hypothetical protein